MTRRHLTWLAIALLALSWPLFGAFTITLVNYIGLYSLVAVGLVMLTGVGGITSFGQAAFVGLGAYATAWICTSPTATHALSALPAGALPWLGLLLGLAVTALIAWFLGAVTLPLAGHFLPLGTLAWGLSLYYIFGNLEGLGGFTGITGVPPLSIAGYELSSPRVLGVLIWAVLLLAIWGLHNLLDSREGRAIRALKSGRVMAESMGVDTARQRMKLFVLAALLSAVSGWLYAHLQRFVNPTPFDLNIGIEYLFMAVVGGSGYLWGAVLGATLITLLKEQLQDWLPRLLGASGNFEVIVFGLLMLLVLQRAADGLWPLIAAWVNRFLKPAKPRAQAVAAVPLARHTLPPAGQVVLQAKDVTKRFSGLVANNAVNLDVRSGEVHALIGPNGAGKSTFFNMISGVTTRPRAPSPCWARPWPASPRAPLPRWGWDAPSSTCGCWASAACSRTWPWARTCGRGVAGWRPCCAPIAARRQPCWPRPAARSSAAAWPSTSTPPRPRCPWASSASSRSRGRWRASPPSCCWTSRPPACATSRSRPWPNC